MFKTGNKVKEFLKYYPEHNVIFNKFKQLTYNYTIQYLLIILVVLLEKKNL